MKKNLAVFLIFSLILGASFSSAWAKQGEDATVRNQVQSFFNSVAEMFDQKNIEGLAKTMIPGATLRYSNGTEMTFEEWKERTAKEFAGISKMKSRFIVGKVVSRGDTVIATYKEFHTYALSAEKGHKYRNVSSWTATFVKTPQGLKATHLVEHFEKASRDGRPLKAEITTK